MRVGVGGTTVGVKVGGTSVGVAVGGTIVLVGVAVAPGWGVFVGVEVFTTIGCVFERGVGETLACGSGACAAVAVLRTWQRVDAEVRVQLPGGELQISWSGPGHSIWMTGPATTVFEGEWNDE